MEKGWRQKRGDQDVRNTADYAVGRRAYDDVATAHPQY